MMSQEQGSLKNICQKERNLNVTSGVLFLSETLFELYLLFILFILFCVSTIFIVNMQHFHNQKKMKYYRKIIHVYESHKHLIRSAKTFMPQLNTSCQRNLKIRPSLNSGQIRSCFSSNITLLNFTTYLKLLSTQTSEEQGQTTGSVHEKAGIPSLGRIFSRFLN